jgi:hypothetical protein
VRKPDSAVRFPKKTVENPRFLVKLRGTSSEVNVFRWIFREAVRKFGCVNRFAGKPAEKYRLSSELQDADRNPGKPTTKIRFLLTVFRSRSETLHFLPVFADSQVQMRFSDGFSGKGTSKRGFRVSFLAERHERRFLVVFGKN